MCGRFSNIAPEGVAGILDDVMRDIDAKAATWRADADALPVEDVRPSARVATIAPIGNGLATMEFIWGLLAPWDSRKLLFNARVEKASGADGMWPPIAGQFRCLVPASRFWERSREGDPVAFRGVDASLIMMAGVFLDDRMSLVTTAPEPEVARFHDRMPLCLTPSQAQLWLSGAWRDAACAAMPPKVVADQSDITVQQSLF